MELFENIRREYEFGEGTIAGVARKLGVHRRMVREAIRNALPMGRKRPDRRSLETEAVIPLIEEHAGSGPERTAQAAAHGASDLAADQAGHPRV